MAAVLHALNASNGLIHAITNPKTTSVVEIRDIANKATTVIVI
jgi:hypothetical protein